MALKRQGDWRYGDSQEDIRAELLRYSSLNGYEAEYFADAVCKCGGKVFRLELDEGEGVAIRTCIDCAMKHPIGDSDEYLEEAEPKECACRCGNEDLEISVGVALYQDSNDVKWLYLGCRCPQCKLTAVYGDWKNEFTGYEELLARV